MNRQLLALRVLALTFVVAASARASTAQAPLVWERLGDRPIDAMDLVFSPEGTLWGGAFRIWRLDGSGGGPGVWVEVADRYAEMLHFLSADSLLRGGLGTWRSLDRGVTWTETLGAGRAFLYEVQDGIPGAGTLYTGINGGLVRSTNRGATWTPAAFETTSPSNTMSAFVALPGGRLVATGNDGIVYSDDGGVTFRPTGLWQFSLRYLGRSLGVVTAPDGTPRVLAVMVDATLPYANAYWSDDGVSWTGAGPLPDASPGGGGTAGPDIHALGGPSALIVLKRGEVYQTDDAGGTWGLIGRAPVDTSLVSASASAVGPDGRLYVGLTQRGQNGTRGWVYRTTEPVVVAGAATPEVPGLSLSVRPNPAGASVSVVVTVPEPRDAVVTVLDAQGREVARIKNGPLSGGATAFALDTSGWAAGAYVVRATSGSHTATARLVVAR